MKFGKHIQKKQLEIPEYAASFVDYKALKKLIKELKNSPVVRAEARPFSNSALNDPQAALQANKAPFFFRLDRELDKVNNFYSIKEHEYKVRLRVLIDKQKSMRLRNPVISKTSTHYVTLEQGFRDFIKDLSKLQQFIDVNATAFAKILKKWDKTSKSQTKELYLSRAVEVQPCFNHDIVSDLSDQANSSLLDCAAWAEGDSTLYETTVHDAMMIQTPRLESDETDSDLQEALNRGDLSTLRGLVSHLQSTSGAGDRLTKAFLGAVSLAPEAGLRLLLETNLIDLHRQDEINDRNCLHKAAMSGRDFFLKIGLAANVDPTRVDAYGRIPLHYACMNGHVHLIDELVTAKPDTVDMRDLDNFSGLIHAIVHGQLQSVEKILSYGACIDAVKETDHFPLNLACQQGSTAIVELLLQKKPRISPDAEGLYPQHLVARFGRDPKLFTMLRDYGANLDQPDKLYQWTPIFHAASEGRTECLQALLECGVNANAIDEKHLSALYYATWEGHLDCMQTLYALVPTSRGKPSAQKAAKVPALSVEPPPLDQSGDIELIPDLSLPPPIIPTRRYGHNFLDNKTTVVLNFEDSPRGAVTFYDESKYPAARLTIAPKSSDIVPRNILLPIQEENRSISFEMDTLDNFTVDFDLYPTFGKKVIAKGSVAADVFKDSQSSSGFHHVSLLDPRLRSVGQLSFRYQVIKPYSGTPLDITPFATYWKATSKSEFQPASLVTGSSLSGEYVRIPVQLSWDGVAIICPEWTLPCNGIDIPVLGLEFSKFQRLGADMAMDASVLQQAIESNNLQELATALSASFTSLEDALVQIPTTVNVDLHVLYPTRDEETKLRLGPTLNVNWFVDSLLKVVFKHARDTRAHSGDRMRSIVFTSYNKDLCSALNWKQPNYPVLMCNHLGAAVNDAANHHATTSATSKQDRNAMSIKEAVRIAQSNNFLGLICRSELLDTVPALVNAVKVAGLVLVSDAQGSTTTAVGNSRARRTTSLPEGVDGVLQSSGVLKFNETIDI